MYRWLEGWSTINALYFSVVTLATVGFGDLHPTTDVAKLFTVVYILFGLGVIAAFISELTKHRAQLISELKSNGAAALLEPSQVVTAPAPDSSAARSLLNGMRLPPNAGRLGSMVRTAGQGHR